MKAYILNEPGKEIDAWQQVQKEDPEPGYGQVLIGVKATSLNYRDLSITRGGFGKNIKKNCIPLSDGAGEVLAIGEGVTTLQKGDRVVGSFFQTWQAGEITAFDHQYALGGPIDGMLAEKVVLNANGVVRFPAALSFEEAATLPCAALTAWNALMENGTPHQLGASILTLGTGGVSIFAIQFALAAGLDVIATSSSDEKLARLSGLGIVKGINYKKIPDWEQAVKEYTQQEGVDQVIEVGGAGTLARSLEATKTGGTVSLIGVLTGVSDAINPVNILFKSICLQGIYVGSITMFSAMNRAIAARGIKPVIDSIYEFDQAKEALKKLISGKHFGKIVIRVAN